MDIQHLQQFVQNALHQDITVSQLVHSHTAWAVAYVMSIIVFGRQFLVRMNSVLTGKNVSPDGVVRYMTDKESLENIRKTMKGDKFETIANGVALLFTPLYVVYTLGLKTPLKVVGGAFHLLSKVVIG